MSFESLKYPLAVILLIPVSFIGVFLVFGLSDFTFDQGGFAAFVMLSGIVVNAGIYMVNEMTGDRSGRDGVRKYVRAFNHKIKPVMLTVISTVLGLIPFLFDGPDEVFWFAFAILLWELAQNRKLPFRIQQIRRTYTASHHRRIHMP